MTRRGYILFETIIAMTVLSVGLVAIHGAMRQSLAVRALARDLTQARFLLEQVVARVELQPCLVSGWSDSGTFDAPFSNFRWEWKITTVQVPAPERPPAAPAPAQQRKGKLEVPVKRLGKITASVSWNRGGRSQVRTLESLFSAYKLYAPTPQGPSGNALQLETL